MREFTNNAFNQHHGMQSTERFGVDTDPDADGVTNELTRADITAAVLFQVSLPVPTQVMPDSREARDAVGVGDRLFHQIGCTACHIPALPLDRKGWIFSEPNPYNPPGNLQLDEAPELRMDLTSDDLPGPRLKPDAHGVVWVPAYTDLKLHDICGGPDDPNNEPLNMQAPNGIGSVFRRKCEIPDAKALGRGKCSAVFSPRNVHDHAGGGAGAFRVGAGAAAGV